MGLLLPVELAAVLVLWRLAVHGGLQPTGGALLAHPRHFGVVDFQCGGHHPVGPAGARLTLVGIEQDVGVFRARAGAAPADQSIEPGTRFLRQDDDVLLEHAWLLQRPDPRPQEHEAASNTMQTTVGQAPYPTGARRSPSRVRRSSCRTSCSSAGFVPRSRLTCR